ncbi:MAG: C40 family peptidase [Bacteroidales bacterium]|nr:C40 family peptidase [Bacteroidales bacterium]
MAEIIGFCNIATLPMRVQGSHRAEMVSQLLFGEAYEIVSQEGEWCKIKTLFDNYEGYIETKQIVLMHPSAYHECYAMPMIADSPTQIYDKTRNCSFWVPQGSSLPIRNRQSHIIQLGAEQFEIPNISAISQHADFGGNFDGMIEKTALSFLNAPYLWGGRTIFGIDCSGFVQIVFKIMGKSLPRDASKQARSGENITLSQARTGDVAFFANGDGKITHVGLLLGDGKIIHASGKIRIDRIDEHGIFCIERNEYSHSLHSIKRLL